MSTRATIHFQEGGEDYAICYRHGDGYPEGLGADLEKFFQEVMEQTDDHRFNDASYLAAKWIVWDSQQMCKVRKADSPLDFISVGIVMEDPGDIRYRYNVACDTDKKPIVEVVNV